MPIEGHHLVSTKRDHRISHAIGISKFDFIYAGLPFFDDGSNLTSFESFGGQVNQQRDYVIKLQANIIPASACGAYSASRLCNFCAHRGCSDQDRTL